MQQRLCAVLLLPGVDPEEFSDFLSRVPSQPLVQNIQYFLENLSYLHEGVLSYSGPFSKEDAGTATTLAAHLLSGTHGTPELFINSYCSEDGHFDPEKLLNLLYFLRVTRMGKDVFKLMYHDELIELGLARVSLNPYTQMKRTFDNWNRLRMRDVPERHRGKDVVGISWLLTPAIQRRLENLGFTKEAGVHYEFIHTQSMLEELSQLDVFFNRGETPPKCLR